MAGEGSAGSLAIAGSDDDALDSNSLGADITHRLGKVMSGADGAASCEPFGILGTAPGG